MKGVGSVCRVGGGGVLVDGESFFSRVVGGGSLIVEERVFFQ